MHLYFTVRQVPECAELNDLQVRAVERDVLRGRFRASTWLFTFVVLGLGHVGGLVGQHLSGGDAGWRFFGGAVFSTVGVAVYVPMVIGRARPAIRDYLLSQGRDSRAPAANSPVD